MTRTSRTSQRPIAGAYGRFPATAQAHQASDADPVFDVLHGAQLRHLLRDGVIQIAAPPPRRAEYRGETPIEGEGAVARWIALHDRACALRAALRLGDGVGARQAQRAIRSLFLYEHQLTSKTRRQARTTLWRRDRAEELPAFAERARWTRCRCIQCSPLPLPPALPQSRSHAAQDVARRASALVCSA